jgi:hypothetical protein
MPGIQLFGVDVSQRSFDSYEEFQGWSENPDGDAQTSDGIDTSHLGARTLHDLYRVLDLDGNDALSNTELTRALGLINPDGEDFSATDVAFLSDDVFNLSSRRLMGHTLYKFLYSAGGENRASNPDYFTLNREQFGLALTTLMGDQWMNSQSAGGVRLQARDVADFLFEFLQPPAQRGGDLTILTAQDLTTTFDTILSRLVNKLDYFQRNPETGRLIDAQGNEFDATDPRALERELTSTAQVIYDVARRSAQEGLILAPENAVSSRESVSSTTVARFLDHGLSPVLEPFFRGIVNQMEQFADELKKALEKS